jgi:hemoglobin
MTDVTRRKMLGSIPAAAIGAAAGTTFLGSNILAAQEAGQPQEGKSLYDRVGGYDAISAVVDDFAGRLFVDPKIKQFFRGMSTDTKESFKQKNKNLLTNAFGGPAKVISRPAKTAHGGLNITQGDFNVVAGHLKDVLEKFQVPEKETGEIFAIVQTLQPDIVDRKDINQLSRDVDT